MGIEEQKKAALKELVELNHENGDVEWQHIRADQILLELLAAYGAITASTGETDIKDIITAWNNVPMWYS